MGEIQLLVVRYRHSSFRVCKIAARDAGQFRSGTGDNVDNGSMCSQALGAIMSELSSM
jgi:hypothetical protein